VEKTVDLLWQMRGKIVDALAIYSGCASIRFDLGKCLLQSLSVKHAVIETVVDSSHLPFPAFPSSPVSTGSSHYPCIIALFYPLRAIWND
jgi:hypothetical protein